MDNYKIPITEANTAIDFSNPTYLYPEVEGYAILSKDRILIPLVTSHDPKQFLKFMALVESYNPPVVFTSVINPRLNLLLRHRGWTVKLVFDPEVGEAIDEWSFGKDGIAP